MRITKSKYTRGKNAPLPPCMQSTMAVCAVWKGVAFGRELVTTDGRVQFGDDPSHKQIFNSKNICEMNSYSYTDRNGPEAVVNRKNIEPAWCLVPVVRNILVILLPPPPPPLASLHLHQ